MTPKETLDAVKLAYRVAKGAGELASGTEGFELVRQWASADARLSKAFAGADMEWWGKLWDAVRKFTAHMDAQQTLHAWERAMEDPEGSALLACYIEDAYVEPLRERREMMQHAVAGLFDLSLSLEQLARVWRAIRALGPSEITTLYGLWLIPEASSGSTKRDSRIEYLERRGAEELEACGAIHMRPLSGLGAAGTLRLKVSVLGTLILRALRGFLWTRPLPAEMPGHEVKEGSRSESEARAILEEIPAAGAMLRDYVNHQFVTYYVEYFGVTAFPAASATGMSTLTLRNMRKGDGELLRPLLALRRECRRAEPVNAIWVERVVAGPPAYPDIEEVQVAGPHDVMRFLAYDLNASWIYSG